MENDVKCILKTRSWAVTSFSGFAPAVTYLRPLAR